MFVGREREIVDLNDVLAQEPPQFILVYGRRRIGKTTLLLQWAQASGRPYLYWVAARDTPAQLRQSFMQVIWQWVYPNSDATPHFDNWRDIFSTVAQLIGDTPLILILDEFSYAAESDASLPSHLQAAWDHLFKQTNITIVLSGSHISMMTSLVQYEAPLYGRFTAQLPVTELSFSALAQFLPNYTAEERVAVYAVTGGVPAYWEQFAQKQTIGQNIRRLFLRRTSMFRNEPFIVVGDVIQRETKNYEAVLKAIANGAHTPQEIGKVLEQTSSYVSPYLKQLESLHLIKRHLPATIPFSKQQTSRKSRYHLADAYLRFYFRFISPNLFLIEQNLDDLLWQKIREQFRAFVGSTAFEQLAQQWVLTQARRGQLPFLPEMVGSYWDNSVQIDVVAINWSEKQILLGECKWGDGQIKRQVIRELIELRTPKILKALPNEGEGWQVGHAFFARKGFTSASQKFATEFNIDLIDLQRLEDELQ
ncbi:MAG TPA: ATP-binding protein [Anaerolineae bacterium]|nr:ATP-binding protein [Anaerolineae bacterium]